jgi:hypothetical protein
MKILVTVTTMGFPSGLSVVNGFVQMSDMTPTEAKSMIAIMAEGVGSYENLRLDLMDGGGVVAFPRHLLDRSVLTIRAVAS